MPSPRRTRYSGPSRHSSGRKVRCSRCPFNTVRGVTRVLRHVVFHFCPSCWLRNHAECEDLMQKSAYGENR